jgi:hypothetical protein
MTKNKRNIYPLLVVLPFLPLIMFIIPKAFNMYPLPTDPWYTKYTSIPWVLSGIYVYPATAVSALLGAAPFSAGWWFCVIAYTGAIAYGVSKWARH